MDEILRNRIHEANRRFYELEPGKHDITVNEEENLAEQERLLKMLTMIDRIIPYNGKKALDFGAGTGNVTGKLLQIGYEVVAVDISNSNCEILGQRFKNYLASGRLEIINSPIEEAIFTENQFDLICCYAVLHHLPDYIESIKQLVTPLKKGGIMYLDNEISPYGSPKGLSLTRILKAVYWSLKQITSRLSPGQNRSWSSSNNLDKVLSNYWESENRYLDHDKIKKVFGEQDFSYFERFDYHSSIDRCFAPFSYIVKHALKPDLSFWIAKK